MSEFILLRGQVRGLEDFELTRLSVSSAFGTSGDLPASLRLCARVDEYWTVAPREGGCFDDIVVDAQRATASGTPLLETRLGGFLERCAASVEELILWYAADAEDLDEVGDPVALLQAVEVALREPTAEIYVRYLASREHGADAMDDSGRVEVLREGRWTTGDAHGYVWVIRHGADPILTRGPVRFRECACQPAC